MATLADIQKNADGSVFTFVGSPIPAGHFTATATILGLSFVYLLEGERDDLTAEIKGHVVGNSKSGVTADAFAMNGLIGGTYLGKVKSFAEAYAQMV